MNTNTTPENEVTAAPYLPGKDPLTPGKNTTEFLTTVAGLFLSAVLALLAAFDVLHLSEPQKETVFQFVGISWIAIPIAYAFARSYVKGKAVSGASGASK